jgi:hypothetical protein
MVHLLEATTHAASVAVYDPQALPTNFESDWQRDRLAAAQTLRDDGEMFWIYTGKNGTFGLAVCVDEEAPQTLRPYLRESIIVPRLKVPSGALTFRGAEHANREPRPDKSETLQLAPGIYKATFYRTEYPPGLMARELSGVVGAFAVRFEKFIGFLMGASVVGAIGALVAMLLTSFAVWTIALEAVCAVLFFVAAYLFQSNERLHLAQDESRAVQRKYPSAVALLRRIAAQ